MKNALVTRISGALMGAAAVGVLLADKAHAAIDLPETIAITDMETYAGTILAALAGMWIIRKLIKTTNRS